jgi:aminoglycoside/choline kinase family phosphotransferase
MIDFQGAFLAPPEYDLVCLLYDLQTDLPEASTCDLLESTRPLLPDAPPPDVLAERFDALAIARLCKDVSHVTFAARRGGDGRRWHELPRGLELIRRAAGRREHRFPGLGVLHSVTDALAQALATADQESS